MRALWCGALALALLSGLAPGAAAAEASAWNGACSSSDGTLSVTLAATDNQSELTRRGSRFLLDGTACSGSRAVDEVRVTDVPGHDSNLRLVVPARGFISEGADIDWRVALGDGADSLSLQGTSGDQSIDVSGYAINLNSRHNDRFELLAKGVEDIELAGGAGDDRLRSSVAASPSRSGDRSAAGPSTANAALGSYPTARMFGGSGNDTLNGDAKVNLIVAGDGNDTVYAKGADDEVQGGQGSDVIFGGDGDDLINGGRGDDEEYGLGNNDLFQQAPQEIYTSTSAVAVPDVGRAQSFMTVPATTSDAIDVNVRVYVDHPRPEDLWLTLVSPQGNWVRLQQREGNGTPLDGTQFDSEANTNIRNLGSRSLMGRFHPEWSMELVQGANPTGQWSLMVDDKVAGGTGTIRGWELELGLPTDDGNGSDKMGGGAGGLDLVVYSPRTQAVNATLLAGADDGQAGENDSIGVPITCPAAVPAGGECADLEWAYGGLGDDTISGTDDGNDLRGAVGHDALVGRDGSDQLRGGNGRDDVAAGGGNDVIHGQANPDTINGGDGSDRAFYGYAPVGMDIDLSDPAAGSASDGEPGNDDDIVTFVENITGSNHADEILGTKDVPNAFAGGPGDDLLNGGTGTGVDALDGADGTDTCLNGEINSSCEITTVPDTEAPTVPANLAASVNPDYDVSLTWDEATDNVGVDHYAIYRDAVLLDTTQAEAYTDSSTAPGGSYSYTVTAVDAEDNESGPSDAVQVVADSNAPSAPADLDADLNAAEDVELTWTAATDDVAVDRYGIYRDGSRIDTSATTSYTDTTVANGATYTYTVTALDAADNESGTSNAVEITIGDTVAPSVPDGVTAQGISTTKVKVTWNASTDDSASVTYDVYRGEDLIGSTTSTEFIDGSLSPGTTATYKLKARDDSSNSSDFSATADGTTFPLLFSDNFDSGNLSTWSSHTNMSVTTPTGEPDPVAGAASTGSTRSFATKSLGTSESTIYVRGKVRIDSGSTVANLFRLQTPGGGSVLTLFSSASKNVMLRNDVTGSNMWSGKTFALGAWHDVQVRVTINGASSQTQVWLDGEKIPGLSGTANLGTNPIGQLMMGDNTLNRSYSTSFDDVSVAAGFID